MHFSLKKKYTNVEFINNGGWHFSNIKKAEEIRYKLKSYLHHREFDLNPLSIKDINKIINNKTAVYDLKVDKRIDKIGGTGAKLTKSNLKKIDKTLLGKESFENEKDKNQSADEPTR